MKKRSKLITLIVAVLAALIAAFALAGCDGKKPEPDNSPLADTDYTVQTDSTIEAGEKFTPAVEVRNGATIKKIELTDKDGKTVALGEDMSFTATTLGVYTYKITFEKNGVTKEVSFTVTARDGVAPVVTKKIADKTGVEIGYYDGFSDDAKELEATDNYDDMSHIKIAVKSIAYGGSNFTGIGGGFFFENIGDYTVTLEVSDRSGNVTETDYKITTVDTAAPVIKNMKPSFAWIADTVAVPTPEVYEIGGYDLAVTAKKNGTNVPVADMSFAPDEIGEYEITYLATDASGNTSKPVTAIVNVIARGTVADFNSDAEGAFWQTADNEKYAGDGETIVYGVGGGSITRASINSDWSDYKTLNIAVNNYKANAPVLRLGVGQNGKFVDICDFGFTPANSTGLQPAAAVTNFFTVDITKYGLDLTAVDAIRLTAVTKGAYKFGFKAITLSATAVSPVGKPAIDYTSVIDFETDITKTATYGGGSKANTDAAYVLKGAKSARYDIPARGYVGEAFGELKASGAANAIVTYAYSDSYSDIRIGGKFGGTAFTSGVYSLVPGWNRIEWYAGIENGFTFDLAGLEEFTVALEEDYAATVYIDEIGYVQKTAFTIDELFVDPMTYGVSYGDDFTMPEVLKNGGKYAVSVKSGVIAGEKTLEEIKALSGYGITADTALAIGESKALESGKYTLVFAVTDILGAEHIATFALNAEYNLLSFAADIPTLYSDTDYPLTDINVTSNVYNAEQLKGATLKTYYKKDGYVNWTELAGSAFRTSDTGFYRFKYVVEYDGVTVERVYRQFVHGKGVVADFERSLSGKHFGFYADYMREFRKYNDPNYTPDQKVYLETHVSDEWSYDGDYSLKYIATHIGWGGFWIKGNVYEPDKNVPVEEGVNGFKVVINASQPTRGAKFSVMTDKGWLFSEEVDIVAGVHEYFVEVAYQDENWTTDASAEKQTFTSVRSLIFNIPYDPAKTYYFDSIAFVHVDQNAIVEA